ncbi:hypothetical protein Hanom_Chr03g00251731 [Helianthus anomalus]
MPKKGTSLVCLEVTITMIATKAVANSKNLNPTSTTGPMISLFSGGGAIGFTVVAYGGVVVSLDVMAAVESGKLKFVFCVKVCFIVRHDM